MKRTQIYLAEETIRQLKKESKKSGKSISEIIRESIRTRGKNNVYKMLSSVEEAYGTWKNRDFDVARRIRKLRTDRSV